MMRILIICVALLVTFSVAHADTERQQITWDLTDLFESNEAWDAAFEDIQKRVERIPEQRKGFGKSAARLADDMIEQSQLIKEYWRLSVYASLQNDEDQRDAVTQQRRAKVRALGTKFGEAQSWVNASLIALGEKKLLRYLAKEPRLQPFEFSIKDTLREAPHYLDEEGETLLASASAMTSSPNQIYSMIANADIPWGEIKLADGSTARLDQAGYSRLRSAANRDDRKKVFDQFWTTWKDFEDSMGATLNSEVQANMFQAKARNYDSVLHWQLSQENLPEKVYRTLVEQVNENLPTLHRYFKLRGRILGIEQMRYYDIYPPLVEMDTDFGIEASKQITREVLKPLGEEYNKHLATALDSNWAHAYPQPGKRSGAYMNGSAYDVHPYVLLNHNDDYNALSTYAHEWGHAVHTMLAKRAQPFETAYYSTFTAEIASTINEILLEEHLIAKAKTNQEKLFYLGQALESIRGTFFRQTMFAEFELAIHEAGERGEPLTGAVFSKMYMDLLKKYHGHDAGVVLIDEPYNAEWAYIPHFYYDMYVFQYATSISGAAWFADKFLKGDESARVDLVNVLKAGGSDYAYNILLDAGLDMASPEPYQALVKRMEDVMDRIEALLDE
ncbi:MAG: oligoendopeptidase F [Gammaproteobacteria bacterium]|nr:oligoendopeptidase F [Gammaproteobacteria bacterium]